jgi:hypothetical protein
MGQGIYHNSTQGFPALSNGATIGPPPPNFSYKSASNYLIANSTNRWQNIDAFLGVRFHLPTDPNPADFYYGWIELSTTDVNNPGGQLDTVTLKGYAYQNTPNTAILAGDTGAGKGPTVPEPGTGGLMLLTLGACAVGAWRTRKRNQRAV